jgi:hypothetical protein
MDDIEYLRRRERQERAAAKRAASLSARLAHQEMAQRYAALIAAHCWQPSFLAAELRAA